MEAPRGEQLNIGIIAHVDAGKTTLSEAMLFAAGALRRMGRVDHADAFLDTDASERERGITIFSKQARLRWKECSITLLDTPGHVDFAAETERTLPVLDCALLLISGTDGVQGHTRTLWRLLERYQVPTVLFINKMDLPGAERAERMAELRRSLSPDCADFTEESWMEQAAGESEEAMEEYLSRGAVSPENVRPLIRGRKLFPCFFGAALRSEGVTELLDGLVRYAPRPVPGRELACRVYKISRDTQGNRLTWLKVTGGKLRVRDAVTGTKANGEPWEEKIHQIRLYSGEKFTVAEEAPAGTVCAVTGLSQTAAGDGLGAAERSGGPLLESVFSYRVAAEGTDPHTLLQKLRLLEEEDPQLRLSWDENAREIRVHLMGQIQREVLERTILDRFGVHAVFDQGSLLYKETIAAPVEGVGHYEPLRHYAEVHLILSPGEPGSGLVFDSQCSTDELDLNWQRLILTHLREKEHRGVLTGAPITDMRITLAAGRAHPKHTEGGDFRQATYRAVRQGLMRAESVLLEPWYDVRLELPAAFVGRAMTDLQRMGGRSETPEVSGDNAVLTGTAPAAELGDYQRELTTYTRGQGRLSVSLRGYEPCRDPIGIIAERGYDPERDVDNTPDSVFCAHGGGFPVKWDRVEEYMHLPPCLSLTKEEERHTLPPARRSDPPVGAALDKELQIIYERTYGPIRDRAFVPVSVRQERKEQPEAMPIPDGPEYLLVDGYNIIYAWDGLREVARDNLDAARQLLMDLMSNYQGIRQCRLILVFDAYRVPYHREEIFRYHNIHVVFTREAETADAYIEKTAHQVSKNHRVRVATSDGMEQLIVLSQGALRLPASAFYDEVEQAGEEIRSILRSVNRHERNTAVADALRRAEETAGDQ